MIAKRLTKQKKIISDIVVNSSTHPTAEDIYLQVKKKINNISLTTIYRNLNELAQSGTIKRIILGDDKDRFDKTTTNHYHIKCSKCGKLEDINIPYLKKQDEYAKKISGYNIKSHDTIFMGICKDCSK